MTGTEASDETQPELHDRAMTRSLTAARARAEVRMRRLLDAAFEIIDKRASLDFTVQEVVVRAKTSLRMFYEFFAGKDDLILALFEEIVREAFVDLRLAVDAESDPLARLHAFAIALHEWCDPDESPRKRGVHHRRAIMEFAIPFATNHADRTRAALRPQIELLRDLVSDAASAGVINMDDPRRAAAFLHRALMYSWHGNRLAESAERRIGAEETWTYCLYGLAGRPASREKNGGRDPQPRGRRGTREA
jgi:AcrR family transcriptional regulator